MKNRHVEINVNIGAVVLVELEEGETIEDAIQYASDEYSNVDGDVIAQVKCELHTDEEVERSKRHSDKSLVLPF